ncbi:PQQ-binding-like beta-propeller repeat protein [Tahibacter caeni]|uniref:outer membrane protein assembly factor BamB family protein n=1 Tax=Tahibacter caeni TaxID=1453545 RepID=UPI00214847B6|nr:PQQ-binding-like beta-propeller repeat protein [Tahibacter caeni]
MKWLLRRGALLFFASAAGVAGAGWQQDWNETGPAFSLSSSYPLEVAGAADGSALIGFSEAFDYRLSRVDGNARMVWHVALSPGEWTPSVIYAEPDGSALVMFTGPSYASVARFDGAGGLQWSSAVQGTRFAVGADRVSAVLALPESSTVITATDRYSGQWLWQRRISDLTSHFFNAPPAVDGDGNIYVAGNGSGSAPLLVKLDPQGSLLWRAAVAANNTVVVRDGRVYAAGGDVLQALSAVDGQPLWSRNGCVERDNTLSFIAGDPVCATGAEVSRLEATSGVEVWRRDAAGNVLGVFGGDVYVGSDPVSFPPADAVLQRLAGSDGAPQWQRSLTFPVRGHIWQVANDLVGVVGPGSVADTVALHRYRIQDGSLSDIRRLADVPRGVIDAGEIRDGADLFVLGQTPWKPLPARVRRLSADSGAVLWENATTQRNPFVDIALTPNRLLLAEQTDMAQALVRSLDRTSGQQRWERSVADVPVNSSVTKPPRVVGLGDDDALVSFGYGSLAGPSLSRRVQELQRLDDAGGEVLWKQQVAEWYDTSYSATWEEPALFAIGEDALLWPAAGMYGPLSMGLQRRSGSDGALDFSAAVLPFFRAARLSAAADAVFAGTVPDQNTLRLVKRSVSSGELLWQFDYPTTPWRALEVVDLLPLADGDVLLMVLFYQPGVTVEQSTHLLRIKADGSGLRYAYQTHRQGKIRDTISRVVLGADGEALLRRRIDQDRRGIDFLQRFDLVQGRVTGSQALALRGVDPFVSRTDWGNTFEPHGDGLLISGTALQSPLPSTRRDALLDIAVTQRGDLALQLPVFPPGIAVGDDVPFAVGASYTGDAAITDATLIVELPWQGSESGLSCDGPGVTRCGLRVRHGQITARFDATPGAQLTLRGTVRRLDAPVLEKSVLRAIVQGPIGLLESEASNNFGSVAVDGPIFADGFDG